MLAQMFAVDEDAAQLALQCSGCNFAVAGQLLCQQQQREAVQQARDEERQAAQAAAAEARREEREAAQEATRAAREAVRDAVRDALECVLCMEAPKTHIFAPCGHRACEGCAEFHMRRDEGCPTCKVAVKSTLRIFD